MFNGPLSGVAFHVILAPITIHNRTTYTTRALSNIVHYWYYRLVMIYKQALESEKLQLVIFESLVGSRLLRPVIYVNCLLTSCSAILSSRGGGGGGGHSGTEGGRTRVTYFAEEGVFLRPPHFRDFVKEGYFFVPRYEVWGSKSPYNPRNIRGSDAE